MQDWTDGYVADIDYVQAFHRELTPSVQAFAALLRGVHAPNPAEPLLYCELGCGPGYAANVLAAANPRLAVHAVDFNPSHVVSARRLASEAGSKNITFHDDSFEQFAGRPDLPDFDVIALHGVLSWISAENGRWVLEIIRRRLKPGGLVYVSYNTLPGWAALTPLRRLLINHAQAAGGPLEGRIPAAIDHALRLKTVGVGYFADNPVASDHLDGLLSLPLDYLAHEYFNADWVPFFSADVAGEMRSVKLSFVGSAQILDHLDYLNMSAEHARMIGLEDRAAERETLRDYITNQRFRKDLFIKGATPTDPSRAAAIWKAQRFALIAPRGSAPGNVRGLYAAADLRPDVYGPILDTLAAGPMLMADLAEAVAPVGLDEATLREAVVVMVAADFVQPCLPEDGIDARRSRTDAFNAAILRQAPHRADLDTLASPVTGGGVFVDRVSRLFLLARAVGAADVPAEVAAWLAAEAVTATADGAEPEPPSDTLARLRDQYLAFLADLAPLLASLGIGSGAEPE